MKSESIDLSWHSYSNHYEELFSNLLQSGEGHDVTLVCDDNFQIQTHKFILKACSPIFSNIFSYSYETSKETIYLRGVNHQDMKAILEFLYIGKTSISFDRIEEFMTLAKDLKIKDIEKNNAALDENSVNINLEIIPKIDDKNCEVSEKETFRNEASTILDKERKSVENLNKSFLQNLKSEKDFDFEGEESRNDQGEKFDKCKKCKKFYNLKEEREHTCKYSCDNPGCTEVYRTPVGLHKHNARIHGKQQVTCNYCGKIFNHESILRTHIRKSCGSEKQVCSECGASVRKLSEHIMNHHTPEDQKKYICLDCGKGFFYQTLLDNHKMNVHLKERPFNCRYGCEFAYNDLSNRNSHERKKHGKLFVISKHEQYRKKIENKGGIFLS